MVERKLMVLAAVLAVVTSSVVHAQAFDNSAVIRLKQAGLGDESIVARIRTSPCAYDLSTDQMIALARAGVSDRIITAMVERCSGADRAQGQQASGDPTAAHRPGIYLDMQSNQGLVMLRPTTASGIRMTGNGSILFPFKAILTLAQGNAQTHVNNQRPTFYFYFDQANAQASDFGTAGNDTAQSPSEFRLVRFRAANGSREFQIGRARGDGGNVGIDPRNAIAVVISETGDGAFKVETSSPLEPGEYGFVLPGGNSRYRIYDFSVGTSNH